MGKKAARGSSAKQDASEPSPVRHKGAPKGGALALAKKYKKTTILGIALLPVAVVLLLPHQLRVKPIEHVPIAELPSRRFVSEFSTQKPVIVTGAWPEKGWHARDVATRCAEAQIKVFKHDDSSKEWARKVQVGEVSLGDYHRDYFEPAPSKRPSPLLYGFELPIKEQCPEILEQMYLPPIFNEDAFHLITNKSGLGWPSLLFGPAGSETGIHIDTHRLPFWIAVVGEPGKVLKRFRLFSHNDHVLLKYGKPTGENNFHFDFDPWKPNFGKFPALAEVEAYEVEMVSGDMLYIPGGSPHAVQNLGDNLGISMNYLDLKSMPQFVRNCKGGTSVLCQLLSGKGEWIIDAMAERQASDEFLPYFHFAGAADKADFCDAQRAARDEMPPRLEEYCA